MVEDKEKESCLRKLLRAAEAVGSNPTRSIFINLVNYAIELSLFQEAVGQNQSEMPWINQIEREV